MGGADAGKSGGATAAGTGAPTAQVEHPDVERVRDALNPNRPGAAERRRVREADEAARAADLARGERCARVDAYVGRIRPSGANVVETPEQDGYVDLDLFAVCTSYERRQALGKSARLHGSAEKALAGEFTTQPEPDDKGSPEWRKWAQKSGMVSPAEYQVAVSQWKLAADVDAAYKEKVGGTMKEEVGPRVLSAYEDFLVGNPGLEGTIEVSFQIRSDGSTSNIRFASSDFNLPGLERMIDDAVGRQKFPAPPNGEPVNVIFPFHFQPSYEHQAGLFLKRRSGIPRGIYEQAMAAEPKNERLAQGGVVKLTVTINPDGTVASVSTAGSEMPTSRVKVTDEIAARVAKLKFPQPGDGKTHVLSDYTIMLQGVPVR